MAYHICIAGLHQYRGKPHGMFRLTQKLIRNCHYCNGHSQVHSYSWNTNWRQVAEQMSLVRNGEGCQLVVGVYAFSWGAGWGAMRLAEELRRVGIYIVVMVLSDPVYRHPRLLLRWLSLLRRQHIIIGSPVIRVPKRVGEVYTFRQQQNWPQGHHLVYKDDKTIRHRPVLLDVIHERMDDAPEFHERVMQEAERIRKLIGFVCPGPPEVCDPSEGQ